MGKKEPKAPNFVRIWALLCVGPDSSKAYGRGLYVPT
jgi:hypothetical protein